MADLVVLQELSGSGGIALALLTLLSAPVWLVFVALTAARYRVPAALWFLPAVLAVCIGALAGHFASRPAVETFQEIDVHDLLALGSQATGSWHALIALGLFWAALWLAISGLAAAVVGSFRIEHPYTEWISAVLPVSSGSVVCTAAVTLAGFVGAGFVPTLTLLLLAGTAIATIGLTSLRTSLSRSERVRVGASRALIVSIGLASVLACGLGWSHAGQSAHFAADPAGTGFDPPPVLSVTTAFMLAVAASGLPALATARGAIGSLRSIASALVLFALVGVAAGVLALTRIDKRLVEAAGNGSLDRVPDALWTRLPIARDLLEGVAAGEEIDGSCLIQEASDGWTAEPLFSALPPDVHVGRYVRDPSAVHELDRSPGCPSEPAPLDGPLAASEIPVIALDGSRAGAAISGWDWFRERGTVRVLVQADPVEAAGWSRRSTRVRATAVPFIWELPQDVAPPEGHEPGTWDETYAAQLPVTLLEGPYPVLVAGGLRSRLPPGELGIETLQLALQSQPPHRRDLVLVPRKTWTVQDLVGFCLSVHGRVEGARCVVRPETPARWSLRTHLPLPW